MEERKFLDQYLTSGIVSTTPYATYFRRRFYAYHHAVKRPRTTIFKLFAAHFRTKGMLNHDKIILV